jgi:hypothetical protein
MSDLLRLLRRLTAQLQGFSLASCSSFIFRFTVVAN